jgi:5-formyltetrahydrofolate cyclo-ligase
MKKTIRETILNQRLLLSKSEVATFSQSLLKQIRNLPAYQRATHVGIYAPIKNEPDLFALMGDAKQFYLPKVIDDAMIYLPFDSIKNLVRSPLGILEPKGLVHTTATLDLIIIPGIAFDQKGNRIGFGKGFFDRYLQLHRPKLVIGVAYPFQMIKNVPVTVTDQNVDQILIA